ARRSAPGPALEAACAGDGAARAWYEQTEEGAEKLRRLTEAGQYARGRLDRASVRSLYGEKLWLTASRIDNLASCKFQYFLRYGLKARPREAAEFSPPELGTFLHYLLEHVARDVEELGGFAAVDDRTVGDLTEKYVEEYIHTEMEDFREKSPRFVYLFRRLTETARRVVLDTAGELRLSDFRPLDFELDFSGTEDLPPVSLGTGEDSLVLTGVADRVDGWEKDGKLYIRVVDYKSGHKTFSLTDVWYGMGLQMLLYLFALGRNGEGRYGKPIVPAGVLYVPARDVLVTAPENLTDEDILKEKSKKLRRSGLLLSEDDVLAAMERSGAPRYIPVSVNREGEYRGDALATAEQLGRLFRYISDVLTKMAGELRRGSINADPWFRGENENACLTCDYFDACGFDGETEDWRYKIPVKAPEFWARLEDREKGDGPCP
ncbi:MAG: PD-(D/E)XK nuclease family protein, partial [Oscillospiraceae bacterium]|nr:PD-(D/E)XK nuclease family protein [Oscillospiraceae bacterium]